MAKRMRKKVSIIVLCYNHEKYIIDTLNSIIDQSYNDIEILINDDCSSDNSWNILMSYKHKLEEKFQNVIIQKSDENLGITKSLNNMIRIAKGDIIKSIAGDDYFDPKYIERVVEMFTNKIDAVMTNAYVVFEESTYNNPQIMKKVYNYIPDLRKEGLFDRIFSHNFICAPSIALTQEVFEKNGLYDEKLPVEDLEFWLRATKENNFSIAYIEDPLIYYRKSLNSMTSIVKNEHYESKKIVMYSSSLQARKKYEAYLPKIKYKIRMCKLILDFLMIAQNDCLEKLQTLCYKDAEELGIGYKMLIIVLAKTKIYCIYKKRKELSRQK